MKKRLPRKLKKAMLTKQRLFDKSLGFKCRRAVLLPFMYQQYLTRLHGIKIQYNELNTLDEFIIANKLENFLMKRINMFPVY